MHAVKAKGVAPFMKRGQMIAQRYGLSPDQFERVLNWFAQVLRPFNCGATFPATAIAVRRHPHVLPRYQEQGIEFAVHGYTHIDYTSLAPADQLAHLRRARQIFAEAGLQATGFRSPYLRRCDDLSAAIESAGFSYASNQPVVWDVLDPMSLDLDARAGYERAMTFYEPWNANTRSCVPRMRGALIEIPVSLPDDEILLDRVGGGLVERVWQSILTQTYQRGDLFTLQLHPERIFLCADELVSVLDAACAFAPPVWLARLDEIAHWWRARAMAVVHIDRLSGDQWRVTVSGPEGTTILARAVQVDTPTVPWADGYVRVQSNSFVVRAAQRPFIGLSTATDQLGMFLRQQGYIIEIGETSRLCSFCFDQPDFSPAQELELLREIETSPRPLVRLGRWPNGQRSCLAITGDIDALTLQDYAFRFFGA